MTILLSCGPDSCNLTPEDYQDKFKQMAVLFTRMSPNPPKVNYPAAVTTTLSLYSKEPMKFVNTKAHVHGVSTQGATW